MMRILTIVMVLGVVGCGDPAGSGDDAPERPNCDRDEVVAWLEAEQCPEGYVWGVRWEKPGENGTLSRYVLRGESPNDGGWTEVDTQTCYKGEVASGNDTFGYWSYLPSRTSREIFEYSYRSDDLPGGYHDVACDYTMDTVSYRARPEGERGTLWVWQGDGEAEKQ